MVRHAPRIFDIYQLYTNIIFSKDSLTDCLNNMPFRVIIIGGGLAGNLLGCELMKDSVAVGVYERAERHSTREGLQIRLTSPALAGMRACLETDHMLSIIKKFGPATEAKAEAPRIFHKDWTQLMDLSRFPAYGKNAPITRGLLRDCLADPLYEAGKLQYDTAMERYEILNPGSYDDCDVLIGADGGYSKVNKLVGLESLDYIPRHVTLAAKCSLPVKRFATMSKELVGGPVMCWADNRHVVFGGKWQPHIEKEECRPHPTSFAVVPISDPSLKGIISASSE